MFQVNLRTIKVALERSYANATHTDDAYLFQKKEALKDIKEFQRIMSQIMQLTTEERKEEDGTKPIEEPVFGESVEKKRGRPPKSASTQPVDQ